MYYQSYAKAYHNTIHLRSTYSTSTGMYVYYGDNIQLRNNIVYCPSGAMPYYWYPNTNIIAADRNVFYSTGTYFGYYNGTYYANLAAWQTATGKEALSKSTTITFANPPAGDLHLAGASQYDPNLTSVMLPEIPTDIDGDVRVIPYIGADEACYILPAQVKFELRDANGQKASYVEIPGTIYLYYDVNFPNTAASITATVKLYNAVTNALVYSSNFTFNKPAGSPAQGTQAIPIPGNLPSGAYKTEVVYNMPNSCGFYIDWIAGTAALLAVPQGSVPCVVWPGDVNNDGLVNFGDRSGLDKYIANANLRATWLQGPARYRTDFATNPLTYYTWEGQASVPWATPEGCYMDSDGNGMINNMDHLAIKLNWMKKHGAPKAGDVESFDVAQNYPNPFNPMTTIRYSVPERSRVSIVVTDMLGRTVATLVNGTIESGSHTATFDGSQLESGGYMATVSMTGEESGLTFTRTLKMSLVK
jgi:hypothetical protein